MNQTHRAPLKTGLPHLVHENDAGLVLLGVAEHLADDARRLADVLVHDGRGQHLREGMGGGRSVNLCAYI